MTEDSTLSQNNETGLTEWETRMAQLVGLDESTPADMDASTTDVNPQLQPDEPTSNTQQPLSANPFAKAGLVGAGTLAVVMFAGGFLSQIMSNDNPKPTQKAVVRETPRQPTKPRVEQLQEEVEGLKTKLALSEQLEAVKTAQQKLRMVKPTPSTPSVAAKPTPEAKPRTIPRDVSMSMIRRKPQPPEIRTVYVPQPRSQPQKVSQPVAQKPKPKPTPVLPQIPAPPPVLPPQPLVEIEPPPEPSPLQEWARLAKLGSYGQVSLGENQTVSNRTSSEKAEVAKKDEEEETETKPEKETETNTSSESATRNPKTIPIGSSAKAVLATPVYGESTKSRRGDDDDENENDNNNIYAVQLKQPLKAADGTVALPIGSQILTKINSISENGLTQLEIVKIIMREKGKTVEKSVPQDSFTIRGKAGKPLIAKQYRNSGSSVARRDAVSFIAGGVGKAAELINRTESEVVTGENGTVAVTNVNRDPSIAAGILEGGMKTVVPQITRRNQRAISEMSRKTNVWYLREGKDVQVFVNQETQL